MGGATSCTPGIVGANRKLAAASRPCGLGIASGCASEEVFDGYFLGTYLMTHIAKKKTVLEKVFRKCCNIKFFILRHVFSFPVSSW